MANEVGVVCGGKKKKVNVPETNAGGPSSIPSSKPSIPLHYIALNLQHNQQNQQMNPQHRFTVAK